jgi:hypothetical protein
MDKSWLGFTLPMIAASMLLLWRVITSLVSVVKASEIAVLPLTSGGEVIFNEKGRIVLALRGKLGSRDFGGARFVLFKESGEEIPSKPIILRTRTTNLAGEATLSFCRYDIPVAGRYRLSIVDLEPNKVSSNSHIVFLKPLGLTLLIRILLVVLAAIVLIGSCVVTGMVLVALS